MGTVIATLLAIGQTNEVRRQHEEDHRCCLRSLSRFIDDLCVCVFVVWVVVVMLLLLEAEL